MCLALPCCGVEVGCARRLQSPPPSCCCRRTLAASNSPSLLSIRSLESICRSSSSRAHRLKLLLCCSAARPWPRLALLCSPRPGNARPAWFLPTTTSKRPAPPRALSSRNQVARTTLLLLSLLISSQLPVRWRSAHAIPSLCTCAIDSALPACPLLPLALPIPFFL